MPDQSAFCPVCGQKTEVQPEGKNDFTHSAVKTLNGQAAQSWPVLMVILIGIAALCLFVGAQIIWKIIGILLLIYAVRELMRWNKAKKAGEVYCPAKAVVAYIALIVVTVILVISLVLPAGPIQQVKDIEFDAYPGSSVGEIVSRTMDSPEWSEDSGYVYVYGNVDGELMGFEFSVETRGDYYYVSLTDAYYTGIWWGQSMAHMYFADLYYNCM